MRRKSHLYNSNAHLEYIENYTYEYESISKDNQQLESIYCLRMPVLIQSDKTLWELGNIYLQYLLIEKSSNPFTLESSATELLDFLRFLEHFNLDVLHLPDEKHERVTYRYKSSLLQRIRQSLIKPSSARGKMNRVLRFYDFCIDNELFDKASLRNIPYTEIKRRFFISSDYRSTFQVEVSSSDLAIRSPKRYLSVDEILDGGVLRPLNFDEQNLVKQYLRDKASREFQLMCYLSLFSGARIQTVCTLRVCNIKDLKKNGFKEKAFKKKGLKEKELDELDELDDTYSLQVGNGTVIDTKNGTRMKLKIPSWLVDELIAYSSSQSWKSRAKLSYYGVSNQNYLFLTSRGASYYTSLKEIEDRRISKSLGGFKQSRGLSVRPHMNKMIKEINKDKVRVNHFRFHDLRATFGLNTLNTMISCGFNNDQALMYLKEQMGHRNIITTMRYLEYSEFTSSVMDANTTFSKTLNN